MLLLDHIRHLRAEQHAAGHPWHRRIAAIVKTIALCADTTTVRILLANASLVWTAFALFNPWAFDRSPYVLMAQVAGQGWWSCAFALHFIGVYWRLFDRKPRETAALIVNGYGFALWFTSTSLITVAVGGFTPGNAIEWTMCAASAWALFRTGLYREIVTP